VLLAVWVVLTNRSFLGYCQYGSILTVWIHTDKSNTATLLSVRGRGSGVDQQSVD